MKKNIRQELELLGVNFESGLKRFMGNEDMFIKFLFKFQKDTSYQEMMAALEQKDYNEALNAAHALKGVAGNLSIDSLHTNLVPLVQCFRDNELEKIDDYVEKISKDYEKIINVLESLADQKEIQ